MNFQFSAASYNFASAATRGLLPRSKEASTQKKLDAVWGVVQQIVEVRLSGPTELLLKIHMPQASGVSKRVSLDVVFRWHG